MKHTLIDKLPSVAISFAFVVIVVAGALHSHSRPKTDGEQTVTATESVKLQLPVGTPTQLETIPAEMAPMETVSDEPKAEPPTHAPEYIMPEFEVYDFIPLSADLQAEIQAACSKYEIAYDLILAVIKTESEFDSAAIGDSGNSYGLMQIQPCWWDRLADEKGLPDYRTNAAQNATLGTAILSFLLTENAGDLDRALIAYNGGADYPAKVYANYEWILERKGK